jgi:hypothetical protein
LRRFCLQYFGSNTERKLVNRIFGLAFAAGVLCCGTASAQVADGVVKLGVLNDMWRTAATADMIRAY